MYNNFRVRSKVVSLPSRAFLRSSFDGGLAPSSLWTQKILPTYTGYIRLTKVDIQIWRHNAAGVLTSDAILCHQLSLFKLLANSQYLLKTLHCFSEMVYRKQMYACNLLDLLHRQLAPDQDYKETIKRFESLRGHGKLPRGRNNADRRLEDEQIANAVLGFAPSGAGWAGHVSLILGGLRPVGGDNASFFKASNLRIALETLVGTEESCDSLVNVTLSIIKKAHDDDYFAQIHFVKDGVLQSASYVSKNALSLFQDGAEISFDAQHQLTPTARQFVLGKGFFQQLRRDVELSRKLDLPFKSDWREYEDEEQKQAFHKSLGSRNSSKFLNMGVDTQATWPKEPTRVSFAGHHLVLFPKTKDNSHSISIDLKTEGIDSGQARTLINRFLSLLSWCDNQHAILREGWSGNPVPVPVPRRNLAFATAHNWMFDRSLPTDEKLLRCLAYYREGLNANEAGTVTFEVLSFFKVFENGQEGPAVRDWVEAVFDDISEMVSSEVLTRFHEDRGDAPTKKYVYKNCRVATAHASKDSPSDADAEPEIQRLWNAAPVLRALARHYIQTEFKFSDSYFTD